jgi:hypothetical protein
MSNIIIYTCITGGYDIPTDNFQKREGYEYHLFTDDPNITVNCWDVYIPQFKNDVKLDNVKKQRFIKTHPHALFNECDTVVWVDANTTIDDKLYNYIEQHKDSLITFKKHPERNCIYDEIKEVCLRGKETQPVCMWLYDRYTEEQYPKHNGLYETNIVISHPNHPSVKFIFEHWWKEIMNYSKRDQLSLNYVLWKYKLSGLVDEGISSDFPAKPHIRQS